MVGLGAYLIGGALSGAGEGMAKAQIVKDQERRDQMLAQLRKEQSKYDSDLAEDREARSTDIKHANTKEILGMTQKFQMETASASAKAQADRDAKNRGFEVAKMVLAHMQAKDKAAWDNWLDTVQKQGMPDEYKTDSDGNVTAVFANGTTKSLGKIDAPKASESAATVGSVTSATKAPVKPAAPMLVYDPKTGEFIEKAN